MFPATDHKNLCRSCAGQTWTLLERHSIDNATFVQVPFPKHIFMLPIHSFFRAAFPDSEEAPSNQTLEPMSFYWGRIDDKAILDYLSNTPQVCHIGDENIPAGPVPGSYRLADGANYRIHLRGRFYHPQGRSCYVLGRGTDSHRHYTASATTGIHDQAISAFCQILMQEGANTDRSVRRSHEPVQAKHLLAVPIWLKSHDKFSGSQSPHSLICGKLRNLLLWL